MTIYFDEITDFNQQVFRNVPGSFQVADEFDDLTTNANAKILAARAAEESSLTFSSDLLHYQAIDFVFNQSTYFPSRFCNGSYPVWYGSIDLNTSFYETSYHWKKTFIDAPQGFQQLTDAPIITSRSVFTVGCKAALIDLRNKAAQHPELIHADTVYYPETQAIGQRLHEEGYPGLITQSARHHAGANVVIFRKKILHTPQHLQNFIYEYDLQNKQLQVKSRDFSEALLVIK